MNIWPVCKTFWGTYGVGVGVGVGGGVGTGVGVGVGFGVGAAVGEGVGIGGAGGCFRSQPAKIAPKMMINVALLYGMERTYTLNARCEKCHFLLSPSLHPLLNRGMIVQQIESQTPFTTADGSTIRSILDRTNAPVKNQSLAEARLPVDGATQRHYHRASEEIYFILEGTGEMEMDGARRAVSPGDAILIPPGAWHQIRAAESLRFLCCCAPPYSHEDTFFE